jgi:hypothetical protein
MVQPSFRAWLLLCGTQYAKTCIYQIGLQLTFREHYSLELRKTLPLTRFGE